MVQKSLSSPFEFSGGNLALDLANTVSRRPTDAPVETLAKFADLLQWSAEADMLPQGLAGRMKQVSAKNPAIAKSVFKKTIQLREMLFRIFSAVATGQKVNHKDVDQLAEWTSRAFLHLTLKPVAGATWEWKVRGSELQILLWPVILAATELLTSPEARQVRQCEARDCDWLFVDRSRKKNRRWCDMLVCGNREKARRFIARSHGREY